MDKCQQERANHASLRGFYELDWQMVYQRERRILEAALGIIISIEENPAPARAPEAPARQ